MINFNLKTQLSWRDMAVRIGFVIVTVAAIVWFMPRERSVSFKVEKDRPWSYADLTASFDFPVYKSEAALAQEREEALKDFRPYYVYDQETATRQLRSFRQHWAAGHSFVLSNDLKYLVSNRLQTLYQRGIIDTKEPLGTDQMLWRVEQENAVLVSAADALTPRQAYEQLISDPTVSHYIDELQEMNINEYIVPNLCYDSLRSATTRQDMMRNVAPSSKVVLRGQKIVSRGDLVDEDTYQAIVCYQREVEERLNSNDTGFSLLGKVLYVLLFIIVFTVYLGIYRKDYFSRLRSACMLYALIIVFTLLASILVSHNLLHVFILPFAIVPIFVRVFMDSRTAFMTHITVVLICACMLQHPLDFIAVEVLSGLVVIFSLRELSSRSQLFWTAALYILTAAATRLALWLIRQGDLAELDPSDLTYIVISGLVVFCSYPLLYIVEKTFGFVSDITLIELSNTNKALLRRMSEVAPGTFNHSIQVGNLAAEIALRINANAMLVRTGALYHDIGKMQNPIYFTENQSGGISPHEHLSYIESAQYIISHVTEGLKLADKYHLPRQVRDLIATHHGQGKAKYFYIKSKNEPPDEPVDDLLFTYPGPNPFTKEQAILMMADAVEAASRSLPDYTEQSIRNLVERIIDSQVQEGYFRECPITFRDIQYAKTVLIEKLKTIYHTRISYPEAKN